MEHTLIQAETKLPGSLWQKCLENLESEVTPQQFNTWLRPLQAIESDGHLRLLAPNRFVLDWVNERFINNIADISSRLSDNQPIRVSIEIGSNPRAEQGPGHNQPSNQTIMDANARQNAAFTRRSDGEQVSHIRSLRQEFTFENFVEGKSNQLARAASQQVGENPGLAYNPLFLYGGVGLGKTHLMHAIGNMIVQRNPDARVVYVHSERFVGDMVKAFQHNSINEFKRYYRSVDALLIDDIQFFAKKERSQEEFFHTFNTLLEGQRQVIMTCDRYPKEVIGLEERLKSRFGWGLTVCIEPPELETRVAILMSKATQMNMDLPSEVAFFIAKRIRSNIRELEGSLRRVLANSRFTGRPITLDLTQDALKDLIAMQEKLITIENIQKTVAEYSQIRLSDMLSKRRSRSVARPRQLAMTLSRELTSHSLPEIGEAFGGRDHTTVLHACRRIEGLCATDGRIREDKAKLVRLLTA